MPRRHQTTRRQPSTNSSNNQSNNPPTTSSSSSLSASSSALPRANSMSGALSVDDYANGFHFTIPLQGTSTEWRAFEDYYECMNISLKESLKAYPFAYFGTKAIELSVSPLYDGDKAQSDVFVMFVKRVYRTQFETQTPMSEAFWKDLQTRVNSARDHCLKLQSDRVHFAAAMAVMLGTTDAVRKEPVPLKWDAHQEGAREIRAVLRSLRCVEGREVQWNRFLRQMNESLATVLANASAVNESEYIRLSIRDGYLAVAASYLDAVIFQTG